MADPLAAYAEREVPERTNFFDPDAARTIIARYGNTRIERQGAQELADSATRLQRNQDDQVQSKQRNTLFDQHEEDYQSHKAAMATRGDFLRSLADKTVLDPDAPDYPAQKAKVLAGMHEGLGKDDAVRDTFASMDQQHEARQRTRDQEDARKQALEDRKAYLHEKLASDPRIVGVLTPEEYQTHVDPDTGEVDTVGASQHAYQKSRENKMGDTKEIIAERARVTSEAQVKKSGELDRRKSVAEIGVADQDAFPSQMESFRRQYPKFDATTAKAEEKVAYEKAKAYEGKKLESEMASALARKNPDEYVNLIDVKDSSGKVVKEASPVQKQKRRELWDLAHEMKGNAAPPSADAPPAANATKQPLTREAAAQFKEKAKGDRALAEKLAREAGYDF